MIILLPVIIVGIIGLIAGIGLSVASKLMAVPADEKQEKIRAALPGANCGACGYSGCDGYAAAVASGEASPDKCAPGGETAAKEIADILGVEIEIEHKTAFISCSGSGGIAKSKYNYTGMESCAAAAALYSGPLECGYGCIGLGDCVKACPFGAILTENGKPVVCGDLCLGCGKCVEVCPKRLISLLPKNRTVTVACANRQKGPSVAKNCEVSCVACRLCEKQCDAGAIKVIDNLAVIDYSLCTGCGKCRDVCRRGVIL